MNEDESHSVIKHPGSALAKVEPRKGGVLAAMVAESLATTHRVLLPAQHDIETDAPEILFQKGEDYYNGWRVPQNYAEAVKYYRKAAEQGYATAQCYLGWCYRMGHGVPQDYEEAAKMFRKAAEQGDAWAQYNLGWCYEHGRGVPQSYGEAVMWYRKVADQGNATAQNSLGLCYQNGYGVPQDKLQAYKWFTLASGHGNAEAAKERTSLTLQLSPAEIQKGEVMVREFVPKTTEENAG